MNYREPITIEAVAHWLPGTRQRASEAAGLGLLTLEELQAVDYTELPVSADLAAPEMAVAAARTALAAAGRSGAELDVLVHAWTWYQGQDFFSPPHFIADQLGAYGANPIGIAQMCNGGATALQCAADRLSLDPDVSVALVTTGDRFGRPGFDRWNGDYGLWYGDGATAAVLTRRPASTGELQLLACTTSAAPELEAAHRGPSGFLPAPGPGPVDVKRSKRAYLAEHGKDHFAAVVAGHVRAVVAEAATAAGIDLATDVRRVAVPRLGRAGLNFYAPVLAELTPSPLFDGGDRTGHLGAGDTLDNLAALRADEGLHPGDIALVLSAGAGFTWSCLVIRRAEAAGTDRATSIQEGIVHV